MWQTFGTIWNQPECVTPLHSLHVNVVYQGIFVLVLREDVHMVSKIDMKKGSRSLFNLKYVVRKYETGISDKQLHAFALNVAFRVDRTVCSSSAAVLAFSIKRLFVKHKTYLFNKSYLKGGLKWLWKDKTFLLSSEISSGNLFFPPNICLYSQVFKKSESRQSFSGKLSKVNKPR